jgi:hypothetical protein
MFCYKKILFACFAVNLLFITKSFAQQIVSVREDPRHVPVLLNKHITVIDAEIEDGYSNLFHIYENPSAFIFLTDVGYGN